MNRPYKTKQPGDILRLPVRRPYYEPMIEPGGYVLLSVGETCCPARVSEDVGGHFCATSTLVDVEMADLCWFLETGWEREE